MSKPLKIEFRKVAAKYLDALDASTKSRIEQKIAAIASDPRNPRHSKPLTATEKRSARVGDYRITFQVTDKEIVIADIDSRGQIYKRL